MGSDYNDIHRMFLQAMMSRAIVEQSAAVKILRHCVQLTGHKSPLTLDDTKTLVQEVNRKINEFSMCLKWIRSEHSGEEYLVLVNTMDHSNSMDIGHPYSVKEREVFRRILEHIALSEVGYVSKMECLNMPGAGMSVGDIEDLIDKLTCDKWFLNVEGGRICPGPRCIAEFDTYFKQNFKDHVPICPLCNNVVFYGLVCQGCQCVIHRHCFSTYNKNKKDKNKCPTCKADIQAEANGEEVEEVERATPQQRKKQRTEGPSPDTSANTPSSSHRKRRQK